MGTDTKTDRYDVAVIGGGASGTALLYVLSHYTDLQRIILIEKYEEVGTVNSNARNNSQTLHVGDIETNYSIEKVRQVRPAAMMVKRYTDALTMDERAPIIRKVQKMVLAVGSKEVTVLDERYPELKKIFPTLEKINAAGIAIAEPEVMRGRAPHEPVSALLNPDGYAVDYGALARSFVKSVHTEAGNRAEVILGAPVTAIARSADGYALTTKKGTVSARVVVVDADAYSLGFAKKLGYGKHFSLIPIAGNFYFTPTRLKGKVYRVQEPRMPFAAVHGDPDLTEHTVTRWGPTARFFPVLEARRFDTMRDFFVTSGLHRVQTWLSFISILLEPIRFWYLLKNFFYDLPLIGTYFFLPQLKTIVPSIRVQDIRRAKGYGGMRLQRVDTKSKELLLGEGKIVGENIIFNMTPSPGASVCLYNAVRDAEAIVGFLPSMHFDQERMQRELCGPGVRIPEGDVSLTDTYAS